MNLEVGERVKLKIKTVTGEKKKLQCLLTPFTESRKLRSSAKI